MPLSDVVRSILKSKGINPDTLGLTSDQSQPPPDPVAPIVPTPPPPMPPPMPPQAPATPKRSLADVFLGALQDAGQNAPAGSPLAGLSQGIASGQARKEFSQFELSPEFAGLSEEQKAWARSNPQEFFKQREETRRVAVPKKAQVTFKLSDLDPSIDPAKDRSITVDGDTAMGQFVAAMNARATNSRQADHNAAEERHWGAEEEIARGKAGKTKDSVQKDISTIDDQLAQLDKLETLSKGIPSGILAGAESYLNQKAKGNINPTMKAYADLRNALSAGFQSTLTGTKRFGQSQIAQDVARSLLPDIGEPAENKTGGVNDKFASVRQMLQEAKANRQRDLASAPGAAAAPASSAPTIPNFKSEADAEAANLPDGTKITINGNPATYHK